MRTMMIRPFPGAKALITDLGPLIKSRPMHDLVLWPDQAVPLLGYMAWPNDPAMFERWLEAHRRDDESAISELTQGLTLVEQHWALDVVFGSAVDLERWKLEYARAGDGIDAHVYVEHVQRESVLPVGNGIGPPTAAYQLLWSRLDYVLGNRANWPRCEESAKRDPRAPVWSSGLCDTGSDVPPPRLARAH